MHIIQNYTLKKNVAKNFLPLVMAFFKGPRICSNSRLPDLPIRGVSDSPHRRVDGDGEPQKIFWG